MNLQRLMLKAFAPLPRPLVRRMGGAPIVGRGVELDPHLQLLWVAGKKLPDTCELPLEQARAGAEAGAQILQAKVPAGVAVREGEIPGPAGPIPVQFLQPSGSGPHPVTLFFHMGGCVIGSPRVATGFCGLVAQRAKSVVVNVDYRLAPEHKFPAAMEDAIAAYRWALDQAGTFGGDSRRVAVAGDSAGGLLSAVIAQEAKRRGWQLPTCQVLIYPWLTPHSGLPSYTDFAEAYPLTKKTMQWFGEHFFGTEADRTHPWACPLVQPDLSGLPPALIFTAGFDPLRDEGEVYAERLKSAGVRVKFRCDAHLVHAYTMMGGTVPAAENAMRDIADAVAAEFVA